MCRVVGVVSPDDLDGHHHLDDGHLIWLIG